MDGDRRDVFLEFLKLPGAPGPGFWYPGLGVAFVPHCFQEVSTSDPRPLLFRRKIVPVLQNTIEQLLLTRDNGMCWREK